MVKNKMRKVLAGVLMATTIVGSSCVANAATTSTSFGTMSYGIQKYSNNTIHAYTSMPATSKKYSYIRTTLEVQVNSTGEKFAWVSNPVPYSSTKPAYAGIVSSKSFTTRLAAFTAHEVVGKSSTVKYLSTTY